MYNKLYLLFSLMLFISCEEKSTSTLQNLQEEKHLKVTIKDNQNNRTEFQPVIVPKKYAFKFKNLEGEVSNVVMKNNIYHFQNIEQPIVMVNLFSTWCPPCRGQIPHLNHLQKKFKKDFFILSALVHDDISNERLNKFIVSEKINFYISNNQEENLKFAELITPKLRLKEHLTMPLMVLFLYGKYFTHYEGSMPEEMIESDIKLLLKKIEG